MKILIVSDTHGRLGDLQELLERVDHIDALVHCGDIERDEEYLRMIAKCPVYIVAGNNDWGIALEREIITFFGKYKVMICHGHTYSVNYGLERLASVAKERNLDAVFFGHTHMPVVEQIDGVTLVNPGSLCYPRQYGRVPTFAYMEIDKEGKAHYWTAEYKKI